jgi:beta-1,4-mannosyltransferase
VAVAEQTPAQQRPPAAVPAAPLRLAYVGAAPTNPYLQLLYAHLGRRGIAAERCESPSLRWLVRARGEVDVLHLHWPESLYRAQRGPRALRGPLSWLKLGRLAVRLAAARALGLRLVWTIHQVVPHERSGRGIDLAGARVIARFAGLLVAHDAATAADAARRLGARSVHVVPHGSYRGVYPPDAGRAATRRRLAIPADAFVYLAFGQLRGYKGIADLLAAFGRLPGEGLRLLVAGSGGPRGDVEALVRDAADEDGRIVPLLEVVPDAQVADLYSAADVAVVARADGGTSGALVLALTLGTPVVATRRGAYPELVGDRAGWLFDPDAPDGLRRALAEAAASAHELPERARAAAARGGALDWDAAAERLVELLGAITRTPRQASR